MDWGHENEEERRWGPYNVPELPAYSQLFHPNGDVRRDDGVPLPLYTPCLTENTVIGVAL